MPSPVQQAFHFLSTCLHFSCLSSLLYAPAQREGGVKIFPFDVGKMVTLFPKGPGYGGWGGMWPGTKGHGERKC